MQNICAFVVRYFKVCLIAFLAALGTGLFYSSTAWPGSLKGPAAENPSQTSTSSSDPGFELGESWLNPYLELPSLDDLFKTIAEGVRFEPYEGILRGAMGTAISHRGNALDQALLLKRVLTLQGYQSRLVSGKLEKTNAMILLRGMYPPQLPEFNFSVQYDPFALEKSDRLLNTVRTHYWVEIHQDSDQWLPLDPSFPRAKIGEAYAEADHYYQQPLDEWKQTVALRFMQQTKDNKTKTVFDMEMSVEDLGYLPLSFSCMGIPLAEPEPASKDEGSALGLFGKSLDNKKDLEEKTSEPDPESEILGTQYSWALRMRGQGSRQASHSVLFSQPESFIAKEWLEITIKIPGQPDRILQRVLFAAEDDDPKHQPSLYRRYLFEVLPGSVSPELAEAMHAQFSEMPLENWQRSMMQAQASEDSGRILGTDETLATGLLQMIITRFAEASDEITDRVAYRNGVAVIRARPRIIIAAAELKNSKLQFSMDLRLDEVDAIPFPGIPANAAHLFQMGRGILESTAEGQVLQELTGVDFLTTSSLMSLAQSEGISLQVVDESGLGNLMKRSKFPLNVRRILTASVIGGREIIIPEKPVQIAGVDRWGWWQVEKATGRIIGVMDNGLHAGMAEYTMSTTKISLDPRMGFVVGMIVGADSTLFTISGLMIKHGQVTAALIKEAKDYIQSVLCSSCPKAEAKASASISVGGDCLKWEKQVSVGAQASIDFCDQYLNGFKCAAGLLMSGLTGEGGNTVEVKGETSYEAGCK